MFGGLTKVKTVGPAHTRKLFEKSLNKNFDKNRENRAIFGNHYSKNALAHFNKVFASLFSKSEWEFEGKALKVLISGWSPQGL